ncbi:hypothetical protein ElyMa_000903500 [Elysia marginata]|uniref:Uncharacterized protein n=1 Tax=Elysia marginata TaxID=1093978 RepID=A0AAV4H9R7_9GAST|nr:hypothetical protein ElyMa_000903500 [Elysia marginata]
MNSTHPVFVLGKDLPEEPRLDNYDLCMAIAKIVGREGVLGAQRIGALWRIYLPSPEARATLLARGLCIGGRTVRVSSQNHFIVRGPDGKEMPGTRLKISDVPFSFSNTAIESALIKKGIKLRSRMRMEEIRDKEGRLTEWWSGRRFCLY